MARVFYLSHPEVVIDPAVPVPDWPLSPQGRERVLAHRREDWLSACSRVVSSAERKAVETAELIVAVTAAELEIRPAMHENDRSATGFLPPATFEAVADQFFAKSDQSVRGWERAIDAQARIAGEVDIVLSRHDPSRSLLLVGHGGVGTLLFCQLAGLAIDRAHDQPRAGSVFAFDRTTRRPLFSWIPLEAVAARLETG